jgi:hypothetical protein
MRHVVKASAAKVARSRTMIINMIRRAKDLSKAAEGDATAAA